MRMMKFAAVMAVFAALLVSGCATQDSVNTPEGMTSRINAMMDAHPDSQVALVIVVPSVGDALSDAIMLAAIKGGAQTSAVESLSGILKKGSDKPVAVTGDHDGITAATIDSAMDSLKGAQSTVQLFFIGDAGYGPELKKKADALGIRFEVVPYPPVK